jgi:hypothetical protein
MIKVKMCIRFSGGVCLIVNGIGVILTRFANFESIPERRANRNSLCSFKQFNSIIASPGKQC